MKKVFIIVLFVLLVCTALVSCDEGKSDDNTTSQKQTETKVTIKGETYENDNFSMIVADGYSKMDIDGGIQAYRGSNAVEIWFRGSDLETSEAETSCISLQKRYNGTEVKKVSKFGHEFYTSTYDAVGYHQTVYITVVDGQKLQIGIVGKSHETDETLQGMFNSIKIK